MQWEVHSLALPPVLEAPVALAPVSSVDLRVTGLPSFTSLSVSGEALAKAQQSCECLGDRASVTSLGRLTSTTTSSSVVAASDAVVDTVVSKSHSQDFALENAQQMEGFDPFKSLLPGVSSDGRTPDAASAALVVVGHRGCGKNKTVPAGGMMAETAMSSIRENTITSFNLAARNGAQFVEFDVQVTKDGVPIIFHDDVIIADGVGPGRHIGELTLEEFQDIGPQRDSLKVGRALYRRAADGSLNLWTVDVEDCMCTLSEAFHEVDPSVGFNIELKFDDDGSTSEEELHRVIDAVLADVKRCANGRMLYFSSFHPDAVRILRQKMPVYPVFFLTDGGVNLYKDERRNSIEAAIEVSRKGNLQGIVSEVRAVLQRPSAVALVKAEGLLFFTYGELNNVGEAVLKQRNWGIDGVIVDHVLEMVRVARHMQELVSSSPSPLATTVSVVQ